MKTIAVAALVVLLSDNAAAESIICGIDQKFECSREGCQPVTPGQSHNRVDFEQHTFSRCDAKGCDAYPASFSQSGTFTNIVFADGTLAKLSDARDLPTGRLHLVEVVTMGIIVLVSYGSCFEVSR